VFLIVIGQAQLQEVSSDALSPEEFTDGAAGTAHDGVVLDGDETGMASGQFTQQGFIQRFDETHVDQGCIDAFGNLRRCRQYAAESE